MNIYDDNGYINIKMIMSIGTPFNFIISPRGCGKTYPALYELLSTNTFFIYTRRLRKQIELVTDPDYNPLIDINEDYGWNYEFFPTKTDSYKLYDTELNDKGKRVPCGEVKALAVALTSVADIKGFSGRRLDWWLMEEFVKEPTERRIPNEGFAFRNAYETINRNREFAQGRQPLKVLGFSNAFDFANPIFMEMGLVHQCEKMLRTGQEVYISKERGVTLVISQNSPIAAKKRDTAIYRATDGSSYNDFALDNCFLNYNTRNIISLPLKGCRCIVSIGDISIYDYNKDDIAYYVSPHKSGNPEYYHTDDISVKQFNSEWRHLWLEYMQGYVRFETAMCEVLFQRFFNFLK